MGFVEMLWLVVWPLLFYDGVTVVLGCLWTDSGMLLVQTIAAAISAAILLFFFMGYKRANRIWAGTLLRCEGKWYLLVGVLGVGCCLIFNILIEMSGLKLLFPEYEKVSQELYAPPLGLQILAMGFLIPLVEELIFRGFMYGALRRAGSFGAGVLISSILFGMYHGSVVQGIYAGFFAVILAVSYEKSGSFMVPVLIHSISNLTSVLVESYHY